MLVTAVWLLIKSLILWLVQPHPNYKRKKKDGPRISVVTHHKAASSSSKPEATPHPTTIGHVARNELDTHADTCCAGSNWSLMDYTGEICEVSPFHNSCEPVTDVPVARCCTVYTSPDTGQEWLLVGDQMLWFGSSLEHSLINPNQLREHGLDVNDNPFEPHLFGINSEDVFVPFDATGTVVYFDSRTPTQWETNHLPVVLLTSETWDPVSVQLGNGRPTREAAEMRTIKSLTTAMTRRMFG